MPTLILVTGHPASGKSTLSKRLAADLHQPFISRDLFKEVLFETLEPRHLSLGQASWALLHATMERLMEAGISFIVDANYRPVPGRQDVQSLTQRYPYQLIEVELTAPPPVLMTRFYARVKQGQRHPVHQDAERMQEFSVRLQTPYAGLHIATDIITIDTSRPDASYYPSLITHLKEAICDS